VNRFGWYIENAGEEDKVFSDSEIAVHRWRLCHVSDAGTKGRGPGRVSQHIDAAAHDLLDAHNRSQESRLPAPARPEQAGHRPRFHLTTQIRQDNRVAAYDP